MKTKLKRFVTISLIMVSLLFLTLTLLDLPNGNAWGKWMENLIIAAAAGIGTSAYLAFFRKSNKKSE